MNAAPKHWYFEDFAAGQEVAMGSRIVTEEEIIRFASAYDPQPFHLDEEAARQSIFGGVVASGWHTCSMIMRLVVDGMLNNSSSMGSPGVDQVRWILPVRGGDTLSVVVAVIDTVASTSKPDRGVVHTVWKASNQHGQLVATVTGMGMFRRRPQVVHV